MVKIKRHRNAARPNIGTKSNDTFDDEDDFSRVNLKKWHEDIAEDPGDFKPLSDTAVNQLRAEARVILENDSLRYRNKHSEGPNSSNIEWLQTMMTKGTSQDKIAASVVLIQNSPLYGLGIIKNLVNLVRTSNQGCVNVMDVLTDLFTSDLLIPNRKLRPFEKQPLSLLEKLSGGNLVERKFHLSLWYFEDQLKNQYRNFVQAVCDVGLDTVDSNRGKSIVVLQKLLIANPEQEVLLLSSLVNKLGDPTASVVSKALHCLNNVLVEHPNMKTVVMEQIEKLLFRPNIHSRTQYYGICFLSHYLLKKDDEELACRLIQLYFSFFKGCIKKGDVDSRMMNGLLTGVNRAFPFSKKDSVNLKEHIDTLYKLVHIAQFNVSLHTLCLLLQVSEYDAAISDRFYNVLYQKLFDPGVGDSSLQAMFISIVFRAMSKDIQYNRIKMFIKRLLQICHYVSVSLACGILIMISQLLKNYPKLKSLTLVAINFKEEEDISDEEHYDDVKLEEIDEKPSSPHSDEGSPVKDEVTDSTGKLDEEQPVISSWYHIANLKEASTTRNNKLHNAFNRNPLFPSGKLSVYTELVSLVTHFHPAVSLFASHLLQGKNIKYSGDPLRDYTLPRFLERWVFKNPKILDNKQPVKKWARKSVSVGVRKLPVNSEEYINAAESDIPPEELFMYRYLKKYPEGTRKKDIEDDSDVSSVASDEFEGMMSQLMGGKEEIDFAEGIKQLPDETEKRSQRKKGKSNKDFMSSEDEESNEDDKDDSFDESDEDNVDDSGENDEEDNDDYEKIKEEFSDLDELDDDEDAITFTDDGEEDFSFTMSDVEQDEQERKSKKNKKNILEGKKLKKNKGIDNNVFVPAEEFAQMLEDTGEERARFGHLANVSNRDNAGIKQLKWEMARNHWVKGHPEKRKRHGEYEKKLIKKFKKR